MKIPAPFTRPSVFVCLFAQLMMMLPLILESQNFVANGGFERLKPEAEKRRLWEPCSFASSSASVNKDLESWQTFFVQTPDVLIRDSAYAGCVDFPAPYRGRGMAGVILYHPFYDNQFETDYHEFVQGTLVRPLEVGKIYRVSVWVQHNSDLARRHLSTIYGNPQSIVPVPCGNLGFFFSENAMNPNEDFMRSQELYPITPQLCHKDIFNTPEGEWRKLQFTFVADRPHRYFLFGNFQSDAVTPIPMSPEAREDFDKKNVLYKKTPGPRRHRVSYYLLDNFAVLEVAPEDPVRQFYEQKGIVLEAAVLFDVGSAVLKPDGVATLQPVYELLATDSGLRVEIGGHSDSSGNSDDNFTLSEARARSVYSWLVEKGIPATQITWKGFGDRYPVADNQTETGRARNRRVELRRMD